MTPENLSELLTIVADSIDSQDSPSRITVSSDLRAILAALESGDDARTAGLLDWFKSVKDRFKEWTSFDPKSVKKMKQNVKIFTEDHDIIKDMVKDVRKDKDLYKAVQRSPKLFVEALRSINDWGTVKDGIGGIANLKEATEESIDDLAATVDSDWVSLAEEGHKDERDSQIETVVTALEYYLKTIEKRVENSVKAIQEDIGERLDLKSGYKSGLKEYKREKGGKKPGVEERPQVRIRVNESTGSQ